MNWKRVREYRKESLDIHEGHIGNKRLRIKLKNKRVDAYRRDDGSNVFVIKQLNTENRQIIKQLFWITDETAQSMAKASSKLNAPHGVWEN